MIKVGLSGNRYSGKDEICNIFRKLTIPVFEADTVLKFIIDQRIEFVDRWLTQKQISQIQLKAT